MTALSLSSPSEDTIEVSWTAPTTGPSDYRLTWAPSGEGYPSWNDANTASKGNAYPSGSATSHTISGLSATGEYKVRIRARFDQGTSEG